MNNLEKAKEVIKEHYEEADCGIFNTRNWSGDIMTTVYDEDGITIDICYNWSYFEVFGLSEDEFKELSVYYYSLED